MTGESTLQVNHGSPRMQKINVPAIIADRLRLMGHQVDWGHGRMIDELDPDVVLFNIATCCSFNGCFSVSGLYAFRTALDRGIPILVHFDDWQVKTVLSHHRTFATKGPAQISKRMKSGDSMVNLYHLPDVEWATADTRLADLVVETAGMIGCHLGEIKQVRYLFPMYAYGDRGLVIERCFKSKKYATERPVEDTFLYDPSPFIGATPTPRTADLFAAPSERLREWTLAALMPHQEWAESLGLSWPVAYFGSRKLKAPRLKTEADVLAEYDARWGVLSPPYHQAGSGWFRSRYLYAARLGNVLVADPEDAAPLGEAYLAAAEAPATVESYSSASLRGLAAAQADAFLPRIATADQADELIVSALTF